MTLLYQAVEKPGGMQNPQVAASLVDELEVILLDPETPDDVLLYYVDQGNEKVAFGAKRSVREEQPLILQESFTITSNSISHSNSNQHADMAAAQQQRVRQLLNTSKHDTKIHLEYG